MGHGEDYRLVTERLIGGLVLWRDGKFENIVLVAEDEEGDILGIANFAVNQRAGEFYHASVWIIQRQHRKRVVGRKFLWRESTEKRTGG